MIDKLILENFKGFSQYFEIPLKPLTLVFGQNSSGKSAILHGFASLIQSIENRDPSGNGPFELQRPHVELGGFKNVVFNHIQNNKITIGYGVSNEHFVTVDLDPDKKFLILKILMKNVDIRYHILWTSRDKKNYIDSVELVFTYDDWLDELLKEDEQKIFRIRFNRFNRDKALWINSDSQYLSELAASLLDLWKHISTHSTLISSQNILSDSIDLYKKIDDYFEKSTNDEIASDLEIIINSGAFELGEGIGEFPLFFEPKKPIKQKNIIPLFDFLSQIIIEARLSLNIRTSHFFDIQSSLDYLEPVRPSPSRIVDQNSKTGRMIERLLKDEQLLEKINSSLVKLEIPYVINPEQIISDYNSVGNYYTLSFLDDRTKTELSGKDIGYGISQVVPVIYSAHNSSRYVLIEQPELHLHPKLQLALGDFFVNSLFEDTGNLREKQFVVETHSENFILRLKTLIREKKIDPSLVQILYVGSSEGVGSWVKAIEIDSQGELVDEWPGGFFTERFEEFLS